MAKDIETGLEEEVVDVEEGAEETPEAVTADFATAVAEKAKAVASGDMTPEEFATECIAQLEEMQAGFAPQGPDVLGGLGNAGGEFALPEPE